jgi:hypothetical protein
LCGRRFAVPPQHALELGRGAQLIQYAEGKMSKKDRREKLGWLKHVRLYCF